MIVVVVCVEVLNVPSSESSICVNLAVSGCELSSTEVTG